jgi:hypothetical protein
VNMILLISLFSITFALLSTAGASTFVGNGGNSGDLELQVALRQIQETFKIAALRGQDEKSQNKSHIKGAYLADELCTCLGPFKGHQVCDSLDSLTPEQTTFCGDFMSQKAEAVLAFLADKESPRFTWTHENIEVKEAQGLRAADAVANSKLVQVTINQERFLQMKQYERVFVLTHEIMHLIPHEKGAIADEQAIGPFSGKDGGRQLLNSMAAATVVASFESGITQKYGETLKRSQGHKNLWFNLAGYSLSSGQNRNSLFSVAGTTGAQLGLRYFFLGDLGLVLDFRSGKTSKTVLETISLSETQTSFGAGLAYRFFPFKDPLTYMGQSHLVLDAKVDTLSTKYTLSEDPIRLEDTGTSTFLAAGCNYYLPIEGGFWYFTGINYYLHRYKYAKITPSSGAIEANQNQVMFNIGVSYGF